MCMMCMCVYVYSICMWVCMCSGIGVCVVCRCWHVVCSAIEESIHVIRCRRKMIQITGYHIMRHTKQNPHRQTHMLHLLRANASSGLIPDVQSSLKGYSNYLQPYTFYSACKHQHVLLQSTQYPEIYFEQCILQITGPRVDCVR